MDFTLETSKQDKKVHLFPCYQKKYHCKRAELDIGKIPPELTQIVSLGQVKHQITRFAVFTLGITGAYLKFSQSGDKREAKPSPLWRSSIWYLIQHGLNTIFKILQQKGLLLLTKDIWKRTRLHVCLFSGQDYSFPSAASTVVSLVQ